MRPVVYTAHPDGIRVMRLVDYGKSRFLSIILRVFECTERTRDHVNEG